MNETKFHHRGVFTIWALPGLKKALRWGVVILFSFQIPIHAASGTEGASFLNILVGAEPAALGGAYSALASNAYAPTWNPGGLGALETTQVAAQHLSYLESIYYRHFSFTHPFHKGSAFGASAQYLGSTDIPGTDISGNSTGDFSSHYGAYSISYGRSVSSRLSLGMTGKYIEAKIDDVSASAMAVDFGSYYQATEKLTLAGVVKNVGTQLTFLEQHDPLPLAFHMGGSYEANSKFTASLEGVYRQTGLASLHSGVEWRPLEPIALRAGYRTDTLKGLSPIAGLTTGVGIKILGQTFSYAWVPMGELGNTQYFSVLVQFR